MLKGKAVRKKGEKIPGHRGTTHFYLLSTSAGEKACRHKMGDTFIRTTMCLPALLLLNSPNQVGEVSQNCLTLPGKRAQRGKRRLLAARGCEDAGQTRRWPERQTRHDSSKIATHSVKQQQQQKRSPQKQKGKTPPPTTHGAKTTTAAAPAAPAAMTTGVRDIARKTTKISLPRPFCLPLRT